MLPMAKLLTNLDGNKVAATASNTSKYEINGLLAPPVLSNRIVRNTTSMSKWQNNSRLLNTGDDFSRQYPKSTEINTAPTSEMIKSIGISRSELDWKINRPKTLATVIKLRNRSNLCSPNRLILLAPDRTGIKKPRNSNSFDCPISTVLEADSVSASSVVDGLLIELAFYPKPRAVSLAGERVRQYVAIPCNPSTAGLCKAMEAGYIASP